MIRLVLCVLAALTVAPLLSPLAPAEAQDYYRRYYDAPPRAERAPRPREYYDDRDANFRERMRYYRRDEVARRQAERRRRIPEQAERRREGISIPFFSRLFGGGAREEPEPSWSGRSDPGAVEVRRPPRTVRRKPAAEPARPAPPPVAIAPKVEPTVFVAVFGDTIAESLAGGLDEAFADAPELVVRRHVKASAGLVRGDYFDFPAEARKALEAGPVTYAVINVGLNDRQPFLDMRDARPLSDRWRERYVARIDAMLAPFKEKNVPVYWVGLAPSESVAASSDHTALNTLIRERVEASGGVYVDVWEGFVDENGSYVAVGPQLDGQTARLRLDDGVHFSKAGSRKLAHYVERQIRKLLQPKAPEAIAGVAPDADAQGEPLPAPPPLADRPKPIAGPLVVLTAPRRADNGSLAAAAMTVPAANASADAERVLVKGESPPAGPGRMDDHRWVDEAAPAPAPPAAEGSPPAGAPTQP
jgi:hypothetical protein